MLLPPLIARMLRRDFYPHATADRIELVQTHISFVLLTGPYAYKVKKAVKLDFLDFGTLERRRHFCQEEVRLNRRGAPGVYHGVVAVTRDDDAGALQLDGTGAAVEHAVKMRQLAQDRLFSNMLVSGRLGVGEVENLARTLAAYHAASRTDERIAQSAVPVRLRRTIDDVYATAARYVGRLQPRQRFEQTRAFTDRFLAESERLLTSRVDGGYVRDCHGDLHLGNICLGDGGEVLLFDCIEFDERLRFLDVMHDAAFTAMDLEARGRPDLTNSFVNAYAERTGDWEGLRVLPLYLCARAYVRAMVHSLLSDEPQASAAETERARRDADGYYRLSHAYTLPRRGGVCLVVGVSGSGKSTVARLLARQTGAVHIRSDAVRKHLALVPLDARGGPALYTDVMTGNTYSRLLELGLALAQSGYRVILDARYHRASARGEAVGRARAAGLPVRIVHCMAARAVLHDRLLHRRGDVSDATAELLEDQLARFEPIGDGEQGHVRTIDTGGEVDVSELARWAFDAQVGVRA
jgi:uncharacterized protein